MKSSADIVFPLSPLDQLYAVERCIENAEQHLMLAVEQLVHASEAHAKATNLNAHRTCPAFYQRVQERLQLTIELMAFRARMKI